MKSTLHFFQLHLRLLTLLLLLSSATRGQEAIRTLIVGGGSSHDFDTWYREADSQTLEEEGFASVTYTDRTDSIAEYLPETDVLYLANNQPIEDAEVRKAIFDFVNSGKGLVLGHAALWYNWKDWPDYNRHLVSGGSRSHDKYGNFEVSISEEDHPVTQDIESFTLDDELYHYQLDPEGPGIEVLASASAEGSEDSYPSVFVVNREDGRIVGLALGHDAESHDLPQYHQLLRNAVKWAAGK